MFQSRPHAVPGHLSLGTALIQRLHDLMSGQEELVGHSPQDKNAMHSESTPPVSSSFFGRGVERRCERALYCPTYLDLL